MPQQEPGEKKHAKEQKYKGTPYKQEPLPAWLDIRQGEQYRLRTWWQSKEWDEWTRVVVKNSCD